MPGVIQADPSRHRLAAGLLLLALAGCTTLEAEVPEAEAPAPAAHTAEPATAPADRPTSPADAEPTAIATTTGEDLTETYTGTAIGFSIRYPQGWVATPSGDGVILSSFDPAAAPGRGGVPQDETKIDVLPLPDPSVSLEAQAQQAIAGADEVLGQERVTLPSGGEAFRLHIVAGMAGETKALFTEISGRQVVVQGYGDLSRFEEIAWTLQPAEGD
jgi:hypothetical protein